MPLRTYVETVRSAVGRVATVAGAAVLGAGLFTDAVTAPGLAATAVAAAAGVLGSPGLMTAYAKVKAEAIMIYASPHAGLAGLLVAERVATSDIARLVEAAAAVAWTTGVWWIRPGRLAKRLAATCAEAAEGQPQETAALAVVQHEPEPTDPAARWWAHKVARQGGIAPGTRVIATRRIDDGRMAAVIAATTPGEPVPEISLRRLSALLDCPEDLLSIDPIPGRGAGLRMLTIGKQDQTGDVWTQIARTALPGVELLETNTYELKEVH